MCEVKNLVLSSLVINFDSFWVFWVKKKCSPTARFLLLIMNFFVPKKSCPPPHLNPVSAPALILIGDFSGGSPLPFPSLREFRRVPPTLDFYKIITPKAFDLELSSKTSERLVKLERMSMHPKRIASIKDNNVACISSSARKLSYHIDWNQGKYSI